MLRRLLLGIPVVACLLVPAIEAAADAKLEDTNPAHFRVTWLTDPAHEAIVSWNTAASGTYHTLMYRVRGEQAWRKQTCQRNGKFSGEFDLYYHHAKLTELAPEMAYEVQMSTDGVMSPLFYFKTAPVKDRSFSVIFGGDSRSDSHTRRQVNQLIAKQVDQGNKYAAWLEIFAFVHGGDFIVDGSKLSQWSRWASDHEQMIAADGRILPIIPARGNHDGGPIFNELFGFPEDDKNYYAVDLGPQARLITLNSEAAAGGEQSKFLEEQLKAARPGYRYLLAQYHRPLYPAVKKPGRARSFWVPLFEKYHLDLACEADGHAIKRTVPIRNDKFDPTGVVYVGEGGLGVPQRTPDKDRWFLQAPGMSGSGHHIQILTFTNEMLHYRCLGLDGEEIDTYEVKPRDLESLSEAAE